MVEHILEKDENVFEGLIGTEKFYLYHDGDEERMRDVIEHARERGIAMGVNPNLMEELYRLMIEKMVETELAEFQNRGAV